MAVSFTSTVVKLTHMATQQQQSLYGSVVRRMIWPANHIGNTSGVGNTLSGLWMNINVENFEAIIWLVAILVALLLTGIEI